MQYQLAWYDLTPWSSSILKNLYEGTHYGRGALMDLIKPHLKDPHLQKTIQKIIQACQICTKTNPKTEHTSIGKGVQCKGICLFEDWQADFTQIPKVRGNFKFLLVFVDTFSGWVKAHPARTEKATEVAKPTQKKKKNKKLWIDFITAFNVTMDHGSHQESPRR